MEKDVDLEFINKVDVLRKSMRDLANFWAKHEKELEDVNECKGYPFSESLNDLTLNVFNWRLALIANYLAKADK